MKNTKIGLISLLWFKNYGTMLQAFALQNKIEQLGYKAEYINYFPRNKKLPLNKAILYRIMRLPVNIIELRKHIINVLYRNKLKYRNQLITEFFRNQIKVGRPEYCSLEDLKNNPPQYDMYIVGSDQTWNPNLCHAGSEFFLSFVKDKLKKSAYSPSLGVSKLLPEQSKKIAAYIKEFKFLSCREKTGARILSKISKRKIRQVVDPTLLLDGAAWQKYSAEPPLREKYIFCYFLGNVLWHRKFVRLLEKETGLQAIFLPSNYIDLSRKNCVFDIGPFEFLAYVKNAEFICTDSFHGCIFSTIFKRQFYGFCKRSNSDIASDNIRLLDFFEIAGMKDRLIKTLPKKIDLSKTIDYSVVESKLRPIIRASEEYLCDILSSAEEIKDGM